MTSTDNDYWKKYWDENREKILAKRRDRYANDPEYREKIRHARERNYEKNRIVKSKRPESEFVQPDVPPSMMEINGHQTMMFDINYFAKRIGRSPVTIRHWERKGVLPKTPYISNRKKVYSEDMIEAVYEALDEQGFPGNVNADEFSDYVVARWQGLQVV